MTVFDYLKGIAVYKLELESAENFINAAKKNVSIKNMSVANDNCLSVSCYFKETGKLEEKVVECGGRVIKKKIRGLPVFIERIRHRTGLAAGIVLSAFLIFASSFFVWEIRVEGNETLSEKEVIEMLEKAGFYEGMLKKTVDVKRVTDRVLINEDEVSWMAINFDGTVAHVEMKEAKIATPVPKKENVNLVASANGIILRVDAHEGGTRVSKGESVTKGQLLISAFVDKRTGGSLLRGARGFVWANTERKFYVSVPLDYKEKKYTENIKNEYSFTFLGKTLKISNPLKQIPKQREYKKLENKMSLMQKIVLPVTAKMVRRSEYTEYVARRTKEMALEEARKTAKQRLHETSPDFVLLDFDEDYTVENGKLEYYCSFEGVENIAKELEFELS